MDAPINVLATPLLACSHSPVTGLVPRWMWSYRYGLAYGLCDLDDRVSGVLADAGK